jgi:sarcosine oxidase subunit gamma
MLRVRGADEAQLAALEKTLRSPLPRTPNRACGAAPRVFSLAPGDWMLVGGDPPEAGLPAAVSPALVHLADVTDGRVAFELAGPRAGDLLAKGIPLDLHPRAFPQASCAQTRLAQTHVLIDRPNDGFTLYADLSYAAHLIAWFQVAAAEYR